MEPPRPRHSEELPSLVSVILPTYNREALLRETIESVRAQTYPNWELIIVDDGSTDGTLAYLDSLVDPRMRVIREAHSGNSAKARNVGIAAVRGEYVAFQDSDDLWMPDKLERQVALLSERTDCGWSYTDTVYIDDRGEELRLSRPPWVPYDGWILEHLIELRVGIPLPSVMVRRQVLTTVGGFNEALPRRHDLELWMRIAEHSQAIAVPAPLMKARRHPGNEIGLRVQEQGYMDTMFAELAARTQSPKIRRLCRLRRMLMTVFYVDRFRRADRYRDAWRILGRSVSYSWSYASWWVCLAKTVARPALPNAVKAQLLARAQRKGAT